MKSVLTVALSASVLLPHSVALADLQGDAFILKDTSYNYSVPKISDGLIESVRGAGLIRAWKRGYIHADTEVKINDPRVIQIPVGSKYKIFDHETNSWVETTTTSIEFMFSTDGLTPNSSITLRNPYEITFKKAAIDATGRTVDVKMTIPEMEVGYLEVPGAKFGSTEKLMERSWAIISDDIDFSGAKDGVMRIGAAHPHGGFSLYGHIYGTSEEHAQNGPTNPLRLSGIEAKLKTELTYSDTGEPYQGEWKQRFDDVDILDVITNNAKLLDKKYLSESPHYTHRIGWLESVTLLDGHIEAVRVTNDGPSTLFVKDNNTFMGTEHVNNKTASFVSIVNGPLSTAVGRVSGTATMGLLSIFELKGAVLVTVKEDGQPVQNVSYQLVDAQGQVVSEWTTNEQGKAFRNVFDIEPGDYTLKGTHLLTNEEFEQPVNVKSNTLSEVHLEYNTNKTPIDFTTERRENPELLLDQEVVVQEGVPGEDVTKTFSIQLGTSGLLGEKATSEVPAEDKPAVPKIIEFGTKPYYTHFINKKTEEPLVEKELREQPARPFNRFKFVETAKDGDDIKHFYEPVVGRFITDDRKEIEAPVTEGVENPKEIPGYRFIETIELENGDFEHVYEQLITKFVDENGEEISPQEDGLVDPKELNDYVLVETKEDDLGNRIHVYKKINTKFVNEETNEEIIPSKEGNKEKENVPGFVFVETKKEDNGDVVHTYRPNVTLFKDDNGNELIPSEKGTVESKEIPNFKLVKTETEDNGDTTHVYRAVQTLFQDTKGNEVSPTEKGIKDKKEIPGHRLVETKELENGDRVHIYEKVKTSFVDENGRPIVPTVEGVENPREFSNFVFDKTVTAENGDVTHIYKAAPAKPAVKPVVNTGVEGTGIAAVGFLSSLAGLFAFRKKEKITID